MCTHPTIQFKKNGENWHRKQVRVGWGEKKGLMDKAQRIFQGSEDTDTVMMDTCYSTLVQTMQCKTPRMNPNKTMDFGSLSCVRVG